jgi:hypothetical protein
MGVPTIYVRKIGGNWVFEGDVGHETRRASIERLIRECDADAPLPDFSNPIMIEIGDRPTLGGCADFAFSTLAPSIGLKSPAAAPDFVFDHWNQVGIDNFDTVSAAVSKVGEIRTVNSLPIAGWVGNFATNPIRARLGQIAHHFPTHLSAIDTGHWINKTNDAKSGNRLETTLAPYISLPDLVTRFDYLIDVEGYGYSGRVKILMHSRRPILMAERPWHEFYFDKLEPFVHYVPVRRDLADLISKIDWLRKNPTQASVIAENAQKFARTHLTFHAAIRKWRQLLSDAIAKRKAIDFHALKVQPLSSALTPSPNK